MKTSLSLVFAASLFSGIAYADAPLCELETDVDWIEVDEFQEQVRTMGYVINDLSVSDGNCYQMTGVNKEGQGVVAFFNPQTGEVVQEDVAQ